MGSISSSTEARARKQREVTREEFEAWESGVRAANALPDASASSSKTAAPLQVSSRSSREVDSGDKQEREDRKVSSEKADRAQSSSLAASVAGLPKASVTAARGKVPGAAPK